MVQHLGQLPTWWDSFDSPRGDGGHGHRPALCHDSIHSCGLGTTIGVPHVKGYKVYLLVWSIFLLAWAMPSRGRMQAVVGETAPPARRDQAPGPELLSCNRGADADADRPRMNGHKRPRTRRARQKDEDLGTPGGGFVAVLREPAPATSPRAIVSRHAGRGDIHLFTTIRSAILRC
jgi:hypothetical protein